MFKIGMALIFAAIAALAIGLAGLATEARFSTIFLRGLVGFIVAGLVSYLVAVILELKGWAGFDENIEMMPATESEEEESKEEESEEQEPEEGAFPDTEENAADSFTPFSPDNLKHI